MAVELKLDRFAPADTGQMEFYLRWLKKNEMRPGEGEPLGLILCAGKSDERVEVLELETRGIRIAEYLTALPPRELLKRRLHEAVRLARARAESGQLVPAKSLPARPRRTARKQKKGGEK